nr:MAG TPA: hypothetical protein [Caudoviricetes sp.]
MRINAPDKHSKDRMRQSYQKICGKRCKLNSKIMTIAAIMQGAETIIC